MMVTLLVTLRRQTFARKHSESIKRFFKPRETSMAKVNGSSRRVELGSGLFRLLYANRVLTVGMLEAVSNGYDSFIAALGEGFAD